MLKVENTDVFGFEAAIRGMRNPMNSWDKMDTLFHKGDCDTCTHFYNCDDYVWADGGCMVVGENDIRLMKNLSKAGDDHGKFLRMVNVTVDITAPLYWWKEFDTYKVGTVANSCSTMHKIQSVPITEDLFSFEHVKLCDVGKQYLDELEQLRVKFNETKDKKYWYALIQLLPSSFNQKRTVQLNYQVLKTMYFARRNHKLDEWHTLCEWMEGLPYFKEICIQE
jgi:hypothetical protein